jgi:aminoglycoside phosphotransferase (APT) family kinase protein
MSDDGEFLDRLAAAARRHFGAAARVRPLARPSLGSSNDTLVFDLGESVGQQRLVLRRETYTGSGQPYIPPAAQYRLLGIAKRHGIPAPAPVFELEESDDLGRGFVMSFIAGETLPRRIVRDPALAEARPKLARQCGEALARLHAVDPAEADFLAGLEDSRDPLAAQRGRLDVFTEPHPALELGLRWLERNRPPELEPRLLHGDFRNGNIIVGPDGLRAVLDWECSHLGDYHEDLAWICLRSWRFGRFDLAVGGFAEQAPFFAAYRDPGGAEIEPGTIRYWQIFGFVRWAVLNIMQGYGHVEEDRRSPVFAACGRNVAMMEYDLLMTLEGSYD